MLDRTAVVVAAGALDLSNAPQLREILCAAIDAGHPVVVVDLSDVELIDAAIVGVLADQLAHAESAGVALSISGACGIALEVLDLLGMSGPLAAHGASGVPQRPPLPCCARPGAADMAPVDAGSVH